MFSKLSSFDFFPTGTSNYPNHSISDSLTLPWGKKSKLESLENICASVHSAQLMYRTKTWADVLQIYFFYRKTHSRVLKKTHLVWTRPRLCTVCVSKISNLDASTAPIFRFFIGCQNKHTEMRDCNWSNAWKKNSKHILYWSTWMNYSQLPRLQLLTFFARTNLDNGFFPRPTHKCEEAILDETRIRCVRVFNFATI